MDGIPARDTRTRIQHIAMKLFIDNGYEKTSLREIAEQLGVTKAALYYHFKSKEEIVESFVADQLADIDELITWLGAQPATLATRQEFLRRYSAILASERHQNLARFLLNNQAVTQHMAAGLKMHNRFRKLLRMMIAKDAPLADQLRTALAIWAVNGSRLILRDTEASPEEVRAAALEVSLELINQVVGSAEAMASGDRRSDNPAVPAVRSGSGQRIPSSSTPGAGDQSSSGTRTKPSRV